MGTLFSLGLLAAAFWGAVKVLGHVFDSTYSSNNSVGQGNRSKGNDDIIRSSSMFDDNEVSTSASVIDDGGPARGMWDVTSTYYSMMHSDDNSITSLSNHSGITFDDSTSLFDSSSCFDGSSSSIGISSSFDDD